MTTDDRTAMKRLLAIGALILIVIAMAVGNRTNEAPPPAPATAASTATTSEPKAGDRATIVLTHHACLRPDHLYNHHLWITYCDIFFKDTEVVIKEWPPYGRAACVIWDAGPAPHWERRTSPEPSDCLWVPKHLLEMKRTEER